MQLKLMKMVVRFAISFLPLVAFAQAKRPRLADAEVVRHVNDYIAPLANHELSGTLLVARGNRILLERSFGLANYELGVRFTPSTPTNIASITKPLTVIIAARLSDEKQLSWGDTVSKWLPNYVYGSKMTVKQLIDHRAGVPHRLLPDSEQAMPRTAQEMVEIANGVPLLFQPGDSESYSSGGYSILAAVLERAGKQTYDEFLQHYVALPVSAKTIRHIDSRMILPGRASSAIPVRDGFINPPLRDLSFLVGAGSVYTTPHDIFLVIRGLVNGAYGSTARAALMEPDGLHWNGEGDGFRTVADWYPADSLTVIYFSNLRLGATDLIRHQIPRIVAGENVRPPVVPQPKAVALSAAAQQRLVGDYDTGGGDINSVAFASPSLMRWGERFLLALDDSTFYSFADYAKVRFRSDSTGSVSEIDWSGGTWAMHDEHLHFPKVRRNDSR
ncbi:MAG: serine hydrolase domain-containing protein [Gemmatimonadaceae bacterium]